MFLPVSRHALAIAGLAMTLSGCGLADGDGHRFEALARRVAEVPVPLVPDQAGEAPLRTAAQAGLRAAPPAPLRVEVMDPHDLWDAREGGARPAAVQAVAQAATPVIRQAARTLSGEAGLRPALAAAPAARAATIQLGAFSTEAAARAAWTQVGRGPAAEALSGLSPVFETVTVNGRDFTRLKVGPIPSEAAMRLCRAAQVADPWCGRAG